MATALGQKLQGNQSKEQLETFEVHPSRACALLIDKILCFLFSEKSPGFTGEDTDYAPKIAQMNAAICTYMQEADLQGILAVYKQFDSVGHITNTDLMDLSIEIKRELSPLGNKEEAIKLIFSPFHISHSETVSTVTQEKNIIVLIHGSSFKRFYISDRDDLGLERPMEAGALTSIKTETVHVQSDVQTDVNTTLTATVGTDIPSDRDTVSPDMSVAEETGKSVKIILGDAPDTAKPLSKSQKGKKQRRDKSKDTLAEKREDSERDENQKNYEIELEKYQSLGLFIQGEFQRLQGSLLTEIPYVGEVLDFLSIEKQLRDIGILEGDMTVQEVTEQQRVLIEDFRKEISEATKNNNRLEGSIQSLNTELAQLNDDRTKNSRRIREINQKITRTSSKMQKNSGYMSAWTIQIVELENRIKNIIEMLSGFRFTAGIPDIYEFEAGVYYSLRAGELYHMPEKEYRPPVTTQWIEENIVKILVKLLSYHLEYEGINIGDIQETLEKIKDLDPNYSYDVEFPDIEDMSEKRIKDFIDLLIRIIPKDYIEELRVFGEGKFKLVTPEICIWNDPKIEQKNETLSNKQSSELRKDKINKRTVLIRELKETEKKLEGFVVFWKMRFYNLNKQKISIGKDLALIQEGLHWRMKNRGKTQEQLEEMLGERTEEIRQVEERLRDPSLDTDTDAYAKLDAIRTQQQRKIKNLR